MLNIGDFSKLTHVSVRMLRYYDQHGLLKPDKIDNYTGYRMYSVSQVPELQKIVLLRDLNFSVAQITEVLRNWDDDFVSQQLNKKIEEIEELIQSEQNRINKIHAAIQDIQKKQIDMHYNVTIKSIPTYEVVSVRRKIPNYSCEAELWSALEELVSREHIEIERHSYNNITIYHDEGHMDRDVDVEVALIVKKRHKKSKELKGVENMACMMVYGPYDRLAEAYSSFIYWLDEHSQYRINGLSRQITIVDHKKAIDPKDYLTEIQIPIEIIKSPLDRNTVSGCSLEIGGDEKNDH